MDRPYIKLMAECFYNDYQLQTIWKDKSTALSELTDYLNLMMDNVKLEDSSFYFELHTNYDKGQQQKIIYFLLTEYVAETYCGLDFTKTKSLDEVIDELLENDLSSVSPLMHGLKQIAGTVSDAIPFSAAGLGLSSIGAFAAVLGIVLQWKNISRAGWLICDTFNKLTQQLAKFVSELTAPHRVKRAIFVTNADQCFRTCGVSSGSLSRLVGFALQRHGISTEKANNQADCLAGCYLKWTLEQVKLLAESYIKCLQATGERGEIPSDLSVFLKEPSGSQCRVYYDILHRHYKSYQEAIDVIFVNDLEKREHWNRQYHVMLNDGLKADRGRPNTGMNPRNELRNPAPQQQSSQPQRYPQKSYNQTSRK